MSWLGHKPKDLTTKLGLLPRDQVQKKEKGVNTALPSCVFSEILWPFYQSAFLDAENRIHSSLFKQ